MQRTQRIFTLLHFFFAIAFLLSLIVQPYANKIVAKRSEQALFEKIFEREELFKELSQKRQSHLLQGLEQVKLQQDPSFFKEIGLDAFLNTPMLELTWLLLSIYICLMLLLKKGKGAQKAAWFLPLIVLASAFFPYKTEASQSTLFPRKEYVLQKYGDGSGGKDKLLKCWHLYLISEWAEAEPSEDADIFREQLERGLFAFNTKRLEWLMEGNGNEIILSGFNTSSSIVLIASYFLWNMIFAWMINRQSKSEAPSSRSSFA